MKKILSMMMTIVLASCSSKVIVQKAVKNESLANRLFYVLPANTIDFELKVKEEVYTPGRLFLTNAAACQQYVSIGIDSLGLEKKVMAEIIKAKGVWKNNELVSDEINWSEGAVPDADKIYVFKNNPAFYKDNSLALSFNQDWMISQGTIASENKSFEIATTFVSTALSVAGTIAKSGQKSLKKDAMDNICDKRLAALVKLKKAYDLFQMNPPKELSAEALEMAKNIRLKMIEKEVAALYYSKKEIVRLVRMSIYLGSALRNASELKLFKIRQADGVLLVNSTVFGDVLWPVGSTYVIGQTFGAADVDAFKLSVTEDSRSLLKTMNNNNFITPVAGKDYGIVYNVPKNMWFTLVDKDGVLVKQSRFPIAQWGEQNALDPRLNKADFTLDSLTGRPVKVTLESKAWLSSDKIKTGGAILPQLDSVIRRPKPTAVKQLEDEVKELELRVKKKEAEAKLN